MALGSWMGLYSSVVMGLMEQRREQELLLLIAIVKHADPFGFCFPGRATLMRLRHCSQAVYERRLAFLVDCGYVTITESYDYRRRQAQFDFQISPTVVYVRPEIQDYCQAVFDGVQERQFDTEKQFLENLFRTNDSQPESLPESETRASKPDSGTSTKTRHHNQLTAAPKQEGRNASTMRSAQKQNQPTAETANAQPRKDNPQAGAADPDEFTALLDPSVDDDRIANEIVLAVATTKHQAAHAVATYPREGIIRCLENTARRRARGELPRPGGYFFTLLRKNIPPIDEFGDLP